MLLCLNKKQKNLPQATCLHYHTHLLILCIQKKKKRKKVNLQSQSGLSTIVIVTPPGNNKCNETALQRSNMIVKKYQDKNKQKKVKKKRFPRRSVDIIFAALELRSWHTLLKIAPVSSLIHTCVSKLMWDCDCGTPVCLWCTCGWPMVLHKTFWSPKCIEQLSEAGLHEWMPFVSFHSWSHERSNLPLLDQFLSRCWLALCVTMQAEPRIVKQYICHCCCTCKNYRGKVAQDEKRLLCIVFQLTRRSQICGKKAYFWAAYSTSSKFLLVVRHTLTTGLQKCS